MDKCANFHLEMSGNLHGVPLELLHVVGDNFVDEVLVGLGQPGHNGQGVGVVLVVGVRVLNLVVEEVVCCTRVLREVVILLGNLVRKYVIVCKR